MVKRCLKLQKLSTLSFNELILHQNACYYIIEYNYGGKTMSTVSLLVPNGLVENYQKLTPEDIRVLNALMLYNEYRKNNLSLYTIANKLDMDIWTLIDFYGSLDLPIIDGNVEDYESELRELEGVI